MLADPTQLRPSCNDLHPRLGFVQQSRPLQGTLAATDHGHAFAGELADLPTLITVRHERRIQLAEYLRSSLKRLDSGCHNNALRDDPFGVFQLHHESRRITSY